MTNKLENRFCDCKSNHENFRHYDFKLNRLLTDHKRLSHRYLISKMLNNQHAETQFEEPRD